MSNIIASPGVQFNEVDLTSTIRTTNANTVYMAGYAYQGPVYEPTYISTLSEYIQVFGAPTNAAERYLYHSARQIVQRTTSQLLISRLPYEVTAKVSGSQTDQLIHNMLVYPVSANTTTAGGDKFDIPAASAYNLLAPVSLSVPQSTYDAFSQNGFNWNLTLDVRRPSNPELSSVALTAAPIGLIIMNEAGTSVNNIFEGYYVGIADNTNTDPSLGFNCITGVNVMNGFIGGKTLSAFDGIMTSTPAAASTVVAVLSGYTNWTTISTDRLSFSLYQNKLSGGTKDTISEIVLKYPIGYPFSSTDYNDSIIVTVFNLRKSIYETTSLKLADVLLGGYVGSFNANKMQVGPSGGSPTSVFLPNIVKGQSSYISTFVNPGISRLDWEDTSGTAGIPKRSVRIHNTAKNLYALGIYGTINENDVRNLGDVPSKLDLALEFVASADTYPIDVTCDAGLSTIWTTVKAKYTDVAGVKTYTSTDFNDEEILGGADDGRGEANICRIKDINSKAGASSAKGAKVIGWHNEIANKFVAFAAESRKDHIHISDPLRQIFVEGPDFKKIDRKSTSTGSPYDFTAECYWPLSNLYSNITTSYACTFPQWFKASDATLKRDIWIPGSATVAANVINSSPFEAPAGFTRGVVTGVADTAISPNQKQRDLLYKISQNAIASFPNEGVVIYGQKTLLNKPSAFDRINVRRTFIYIEKATNSAIKYFVFEPNTFLTRSRLVTTLKPIYEFAKNNGGIYDYQIVCDERNNTPATIDQNELHVDIYVKPTRTAEFILVNFFATRTDQNFSELIG